MKTTRHILLTTLALAGLSHAEATAPTEVRTTPPAPPAATEAAAPEEEEAVAAEEAAEEARMEQMQQMEEFMMHYFQNPQPDKISELITLITTIFPDRDDCTAIPATLVFFGEVFKANPDRVPGWMEDVAKLPEEWQEIFQWSQRYALGEEEDVTARFSLAPEAFDACWGGFVASGDKKYPEFVLRAACVNEEPNELNISIRAASWSCSSFIMNYPEMKEIARAWFAQASEEQRMNFALRTNEEVQTAVFDKVLLTAEQREAHRAEQQKAGQERAEAMQKVSDFITQYAVTPQPDGIANLLTELARLNPQADAIAPPLLQHFFGEVFKANPDRVEGWQQTIGTLPEAWQQLLAKAVRLGKGEEPGALADTTPTEDTLIACIGGYMATGDKAYPEYLLALACNAEDADVHETAAETAAGIFFRYESARQPMRDWLAKTSEEQKMTLAERIGDEDLQTELFGKVLVPSPQPCVPTVVEDTEEGVEIEVEIEENAEEEMEEGEGEPVELEEDCVGESIEPEAQAEDAPTAE